MLLYTLCWMGTEGRWESDREEDVETIDLSFHRGGTVGDPRAPHQRQEQRRAMETST